MASFRRRRGGGGPSRWRRTGSASSTRRSSATGTSTAPAPPCPGRRRGSAWRSPCRHLSAGPPTSSRSCRPPTTSRMRTPTSPGSSLCFDALGTHALFGCTPVCEQAYTVAQNLDPSSEGRGVLQFKTCLASVIKQKLAKKDGASIYRQNDIQVLWNFYMEYKSWRRIDDMQREQERLRESETYNTEMGARAVKMRKVYATLRALLDVLEVLVGPSPTDRLGRQILEEI